MNADEFTHDIPPDLARAAHQFTSHVPEQRAEQERAEYARTLSADFEALSALADSDDKRAALASEFERYRQGYRLKYLARLSSLSRCASTMVTGGSGFNVRRHQKASNAADKRTEEQIEFRKRALAMIRKILRPEDSPIMLSDGNASERIETKLGKLERLQATMKAANAAIRQHAKEGPEAQITALTALGYPAGIASALIRPDFAGRIGFPAYELTNNAANIRRLKGRAVAVEQAQATPDATTDGASARIEDAPADNRVRLFFPGKPEAAVRDTLKRGGFRWAPSIGCWQAYRNPRALELAGQVAGT